MCWVVFKGLGVLIGVYFIKRFIFVFFCSDGGSFLKESDRDYSSNLGEGFLGGRCFTEL